LSIQENCPVCSTSVTESGGRGGAEIHDINCAVCGKFSVTRSALHKIRTVNKNEHKVAVISHAIRRMQKQNEWPEIDSKVLEAILANDYLPSPLVQADNFILLVGDQVDVPGEFMNINPTQRSIIGAANDKNFNFIIRHLTNKGLINTKTNNSISLSFEGWDEYSRLKIQSSDTRKAFMAMPFGNDLIDKAYEYFKKAVDKTGFDLFRIDEKPKAGSIDDRLRVEIRTSRFLIAELTDDNRGVYWEAGFAEGIGKPVIYTCEKSYFKGKGTHFDTNHLHTVLWEKNNLEEALNNLKITIRATLPEEAKMVD